MRTVMSISFRRMRAYRPERKEPGASGVERLGGGKEGRKDAGMEGRREGRMQGKKEAQV